MEQEKLPGGNSRRQEVEEVVESEVVVVEVVARGTSPHVPRSSSAGPPRQREHDTLWERTRPRASLGRRGCVLSIQSPTYK